MMGRKRTETTSEAETDSKHTMAEQMIDTYISWRLETKYDIPYKFMDLINYGDKKWETWHLKFKIEEISKTGKSMKCKVYDRDKKKWKEYKQYSMKRLFDLLKIEMEDKFEEMRRHGLDPDEDY